MQKILDEMEITDPKHRKEIDNEFEVIYKPIKNKNIISRYNRVIRDFT